ncbi:MAG: 2-oxoacid:acceptor oxidoreductase family protein [Candidatus Krumholzibacteria bacterium]|nr:2-oxoacid:acceptor oxidoreductase family protein [Candidatus Krumholzibacteria bacterium]
MNPKRDGLAGRRGASKKRLPVVDEFGFFEIRLDSIGGLGAHLAGKILGEAAVLKMGLNALHFSSYGSEKKGSPIKSFLRFATTDQEIRSCSPVERPHMVAVFHDALLRTPGGLAGLRRNGTLIINTRKSLEELKAFGLPDDCHIYLTDALGIAIEEKSRVNTALMGTVTSVSGFLDADAVLQSLSETFAKKHPSAVGPNERTFQRGLEELKLVAEPRPGTDGDKDEDEVPLRPGPKFGYLTAPIGGCITDAGNTFTKDLSASRSGFVPVLDTAECVHCGMCDIVCPDQCFVWRQETSDADESLVTVRLEGIDYYYCKGCMRCIDSCPSGALTKQPEEEGFAEEHRVAMFPESKS